MVEKSENSQFTARRNELARQMISQVYFVSALFQMLSEREKI